MKKFGFIFIIFPFTFVSKAQPGDCILQAPRFTMAFGTGNVPDLNSGDLSNYRRVIGSCPQDGYYSLASYTSKCFGDDWHTLSQDHTAGDAAGNMLLVNAARYSGTFLRIPVTGLKSNTRYELGLWLINLCKPTKKCPFLILPNLKVRLETWDGNIVAGFITGDLPRVQEPRWKQYLADFTTPASTSTLMLVMIDNVPGGCGNDFALDDITFRECVKPITAPKKTSTKGRSTTPKPLPKKLKTPQQKKIQATQVIKPRADTSTTAISVLKKSPKIVRSTQPVLKTRENVLVREIETEAGEIRIDIYDNGEIDGDSVTIYHNNRLIRSHMALSAKPISFNIRVNPIQSHHEITLVAENLGSIPPNTALMIITTSVNRYELFISSSEQKNARVVFDLKK